VNYWEHPSYVKPPPPAREGVGSGLVRVIWIYVMIGAATYAVVRSGLLEALITKALS